jgi:hypothetical protein
VNQTHYLRKRETKDYLWETMFIVTKVYASLTATPVIPLPLTSNGRGTHGFVPSTLQIMAFLIMQCFPFSCYYLILGSIYPLQLYVINILKLCSHLSVRGQAKDPYKISQITVPTRSPTEAEDFSSSPCVQTGSGAHPGSNPMATGVLSPGGKRGRGVTLTTHPHLVAEVKYE